MANENLNRDFRKLMDGLGQLDSGDVQKVMNLVEQWKEAPDTTVPSTLIPQN